MSATPGLPRVGESMCFEDLGRDLLTSCVVSVSVRGRNNREYCSSGYPAGQSAANRDIAKHVERTVPVVAAVIAVGGNA
jgi:hypothetical protein